jgi:hypothetical protein
MQFASQNSPADIRTRSPAYYNSDLAYKMNSKLTEKKDAATELLKYSPVEIRNVSVKVAESIDELVKSAAKQFSLDGLTGAYFISTPAKQMPTAYLGDIRKPENPVDYSAKPGKLDSILGPTAPYSAPKVLTEAGGLRNYVSPEEIFRHSLLPTRVKSSNILRQGEMPLYSLTVMQGSLPGYQAPTDLKKYAKN